jgi:hypothetical protein
VRWYGDMVVLWSCLVCVLGTVTWWCGYTVLFGRGIGYGDMVIWSCLVWGIRYGDMVIIWSCLVGVLGTVIW